MKKIIITVSLFLMVFATSQNTYAQSKDAKVWVVKFHADWCPSCRAIEDEYTDLQNDYTGEPILFQRFDFTNSFYTNQTYLMASAMGIGDIFQKNQGIGYMLILDPKTKEVLARLTSKQSLEQMKEKINSFL